MNMSKFLLLTSLALCFCGSLRIKAEADSVEEKYPSQTKVYKLIPLRDVDYEIVNRVCRPWLDKKSIIVHEKKQNSILVYAEPEIIVKIRKFLDQTATPDVNIRIDIQKQGVGSSNSDKLGYRYKQQQPIVTYKNGKKIISYGKTNPRLILQSRNMTSNSNSLQFIITKSGSPASLWVGKTIVDPSWLRAVKPKREAVIGSDSYTVITSPPAMETKMVNVGLSLQVLPRYLENGLIEVEVYPEISKVSGKGRQKAVKVTNLITKIVVKNGAKVLIGGVINQKRQAYENVFGPDFFTRKDVSETMNMYITATVLKPGQNRGLLR